MIKIFTQNELLQYVYNELDENLKAQLEAALLRDHQLAEACAELLIAKATLEAVEKGPGKKTVNAILNYSRNLSLQLE
ncbi:hypothetical protein [Adhaeribacter aquaticus]|uniref:hypothetical protein n=1 Tax=Adhaeribacter aquaticus TaxID=299567 RepID=UPI00041D0DF6|nr:hypothetical protein [Adhaeribacter aquaticus]